MENGRTNYLYGITGIGCVHELMKEKKDITEAGFSLELMYIGSDMVEQ